MSLSTKLPKNLKVALSIAGLSLREFAKQLGVSSAAIGIISNGISSSKRIEAEIKKFINRHVPKELLERLDR